MEEAPLTRRRLVRVRVDGLLGRFDHDIRFPQDWKFLIIHGPNGVGKTRLLELIYSVFTGSLARLARLPFSSVQFEFDDGTGLEVQRRRSSTQDALPLDQEILQDDEVDAPEGLVWRVLRPGSEPQEHTTTLKIGPDEYRRLRRLMSDSRYEQVNPDTWIDLRTHEELDSFEVAERAGFDIMSGQESEQFPSSFQRVLQSHEIHFIATQRLLNTTQRSRTGRLSGQAHQQPTVIAYANDLRQHLDATLASNSRISQELDRSFPKRLFEATLVEDTDKNLRIRYEEQLKLRARLAAIAILDSSPDLPLPEQPLLEWQLKVLRTYLGDVDEKLATFLPLLIRLELLSDIINEKFLFKRMEIDRVQGFAFYDEDSGKRVAPEHLSSGEQHELILIYELIMNVTEHALVLIDEPEISLHVAWQKAFLDDLDRVASLRSLRFIIATHSPQIIGDWWDRTVELYSTS